MGAEKTTTATQGTQTATASPGQVEQDALMAARMRNAQTGTLANDQQALALQSATMQGQALPGYLNQIPGGIDTNAQNAMARQAVNIARPGLNQGGILDSGTSASIQARSAADSYLGSQQFNVQNLMQLMNLATGNAAQNQSGIQSTGNTLSNSLAGLRSYNTTGDTTTLGMNPFLKSFQQTAGSTLGGKNISAQYFIP